LIRVFFTLPKTDCSFSSDVGKARLVNIYLPALRTRFTIILCWRCGLRDGPRSTLAER
jgi:hypothetical protein